MKEDWQWRLPATEATGSAVKILEDSNEVCDDSGLFNVDDSETPRDVQDSDQADEVL
jgi:hypothetical protein